MSLKRELNELKYNVQDREYDRDNEGEDVNAELVRLFFIIPVVDEHVDLDSELNQALEGKLCDRPHVSDAIHFRLLHLEDPFVR